MIVMVKTMLSAMLFGLLGVGCGLGLEAGTVSELITVDQFGYLPGAAKVAVLADPVEGQNAELSLSPGPVFEVRREGSGEVVFSGELVAHQGGAVAKIAGDRVWHADFSGLREAGEYYVYEPKSGLRSFGFRIGEDVYRGVMRAATRAFYYNRANTPLLEKYAGVWNHRGGHLGAGQDGEAEFRQGGKSLGQAKDLRGGWYDAGDYTKYVPYLVSTIWDLCMALELYPEAVGSDGTGIPESGNGSPDLLDELKWELDWVLKMQDVDGGFHNRNGSATHDIGPGAPDTDTAQRFYTAKTTWATSTAVMALAKSARHFGQREEIYPGYADRLRAAALRGWAFLERNPSMSPADGTDGAPDVVSSQATSDAHDDLRRRVLAASALFDMTGEGKYGEFVERWAGDVGRTEQNGLHPLKGEWPMVDPLNAVEITQALFDYARSRGLSSRPAGMDLARRFRESVGRTAEMIRQATGGPDDPYLNYCFPGHYTWGSNSHKLRWARVLMMARVLGVNPERHAEYRAIEAGYVHFIHGRNPLAWCYLSAMGAEGAEKPVTSIYHGWFRSGSRWDGNVPGAVGPPPGYLVGGPNQFFSVDWIRPPYGEPPMKAYRNWNGAWNAERQANEASWEISEPAIYYQASYVLALAAVEGR